MSYSYRFTLIFFLSGLSLSLFSHDHHQYISGRFFQKNSDQQEKIVRKKRYKKRPKRGTNKRRLRRKLSHKKRYPTNNKRNAKKNNEKIRNSQNETNRTRTTHNRHAVKNKKAVQRTERKQLNRRLPRRESRAIPAHHVPIIVTSFVPTTEPVNAPVLEQPAHHVPIIVTSFIPTTELVNAPVLEQTETCLICFDEKNEAEFSRLSCGHFYCTECLSNLVDIAIRERRVRQIRCPQCPHNLSQEDVNHVYQHNRAQFERYRVLAHQEWLEAQPNARHCPTPDCSYIVLAEGNPHSVICPQCSQSFCSGCAVRHEQTVSCERARRTTLDRENRSNNSWMQANTKRCPNCRTNIEKNGGCNHMECHHCRHYFCWVCLGPGRNCGPYECNGRRRRWPW